MKSLDVRPGSTGTAILDFHNVSRSDYQNQRTDDPNQTSKTWFFYDQKYV